jgi:hypothetical protein
MDKTYSAKTHMVVRALEKDKDSFRPREKRRRGVGTRISIPKYYWCADVSCK